jgi:LPXTG-motif cell wall-anchored protein
MRKIVVGVASLALLVLLAAPVLAQEGSPIVEVEPSRVELPLPGTGTPTGTGTGTPRNRTEVLARTGLDVSTGVVLGLGLLVTGGAAVVVARRRRNAY